MFNRWFRLMVPLWLVTALLGFFGFGQWMAERIEQMDMSMVPLAPTVLFFVTGFLSGVVTLIWAFSLRNRSPSPAAGRFDTYRRSILFGGVAMTGGAVGIAAAVTGRLAGWMSVNEEVMSPRPPRTDPNPRPEWAGAKIRSYRPLGQTGFSVSDVSLGTTQIFRHPEPLKFVNAALDRGINYIDTSPDYAGARAEAVIGEAVAGRARESLFIATKWCTADGHVRQGSSVDAYVGAVESSLERMGLSYVDLVHIHGCDSVERLLDPAVHEAFARLKAAGKVRFMGVSTHTPNLEAVAQAAIDSGRFDGIMLAYHHGAWPLQLQLIDEANARGIGVVAMKTLKGGKHRGLVEFRDAADAYSQAAFKWVLSNQAVSCLVVSFSETQHLDEYVYASGQVMTDPDVAVLERYDHLIAGTHCFAHCGACLDTCPVQLPINDILRYRMYFEDYGDQKQAMGLYASLTVNADQCLTCNAPCAGACPVDIDIKSRLTGADEMLRLA